MGFSGARRTWHRIRAGGPRQQLEQRMQQRLLNGIGLRWCKSRRRCLQALHNAPDINKPHSVLNDNAAAIT